jgi:hypothetical protein
VDECRLSVAQKILFPIKKGLAKISEFFGFRV